MKNYTIDSVQPQQKLQVKNVGFVDEMKFQRKRQGILYWHRVELGPQELACVSAVMCISNTLGETIDCIANECPRFAPNHKFQRLDQLVEVQDWELCGSQREINIGTSINRTEWESSKILYEFPIQSDQVLKHNRYGLVVDRIHHICYIVAAVCHFYA